MPKSVYDSLAPLDIPSKPVIYVEETTASINPAANLSDSSRDEKAKLESILLGNMMAKGTAAGMMLLDGPGTLGGGSSMSSLQHLNNKFLGINKNSRNPMLLSSLANKPLPANYVCTICKKPGHHKQLCPEAVSTYFK